MKNFNNIKKAISWIESVHKFRPKQDLSRINNAFNMLEIDLSKIKKIQIIGTNGKGSTVSYLSNIIIKQHKKVGTFISPYLVSFNERIKIDMEDINKKDLLDLLNYIYDFNLEYIKKYNESLIFFEMLTLMALLYFYNQKCDYIVMEAGIGGLLDSTSVLDYDVVGLTNVSLDHTKTLGDTIQKIALSKLGALKKGNTLVTTCDASLYELIKDYTTSNNNKLVFVNALSYSNLKVNYDNLYFKYDNYNINTSLVGNYQIANIILAINIIKELDSNISSALIENAIKDTLWAGRFEKVDPKKHIYIDGAHNIGGIKSLIETIKLLNYRNLYILFSALEDKNPTILIEELLKITPNIILTTFSDARIYDPTNIILNYNLDFIPSPLMAYNMVKNNMEDGDLFVITGSIHFIGYMKKDIIK